MPWVQNIMAGLGNAGWPKPPINAAWGLARRTIPFRRATCRMVLIGSQQKIVFAIEYGEEGMRLDDFCKDAVRLGIDALQNN
jgi:hypothetical protein